MDRYVADMDVGKQISRSQTFLKTRTFQRFTLKARIRYLTKSFKQMNTRFLKNEKYKNLVRPF